VTAPGELRTQGKKDITYDEDAHSKVSSPKRPECPGRQPTMSARKSKRDYRVGEYPLDKRTLCSVLDNSGERECQLPVVKLSEDDCDSIFWASSEHEECSCVFCTM
jgi:hypothetical protein